MMIYADQDGVIESLEECRLNPDLTDPVRTDLEFYIPQLCSYYLSEECSEDDVEALAKFMVFASQLELHFGHRILFFMRTFENCEDERILARVEKVLGGFTTFSATGGPV